MIILFFSSFDRNNCRCVGTRKMSDLYQDLTEHISINIVSCYWKFHQSLDIAVQERQVNTCKHIAEPVTGIGL